SQSQQALAALARAEENRQPQALEGQAAARSAKASGKGAARCANCDKRTRTGPVWRVSGPFVMEAKAPARKINATSVSPKPQAAVLRHPRPSKAQRAAPLNARGAETGLIRRF
ncbi:MAG TPA: hypothetical protein VJ783_04775, partial [Pirellulales bacterium]|nr:hypothetical protein [Pirellulales bacterium]